MPSSHIGPDVDDDMELPEPRQDASIFDGDQLRM
jgi:hypothetical protein